MITQEFIIQNFPKGKLTLVGGRPAMGKTSLVTSLALSLAREDKYSLIFSLEMSDKMLACRISQIYESSYKDCFSKVYIDDTPRNNLDKIRNLLETLCVDYVFIDYIQLIETDIQEREKELNYIVEELKLMANEFDLPIIATTALGKLVNSKNIRPKINELYWIKPEILADVNFIMLNRPEAYHVYEYYPSGDRIEGKTELIRYVGEKEISLYLFFNKETTEFSEWLNWKRLKEEILASNRWIVNVDKYDLESFEGEVTHDIKVIETSTSNNTENRFRYLIHSLQDERSLLKNAAKKLLVFIQFPLSAPITMDEMKNVNEVVEFFANGSDDCEVIWSMSPRDDDITRIVCAMK